MIVIAHSFVTSSIFITESLLHSVTIENQAHGKKKIYINSLTVSVSKMSRILSARRSGNEEVVQLPSVVEF